MKKYTKVDGSVLESKLEHLVRCNAGLIEEGLRYVDHQKQAAGGRLDVLLTDSGNSFVVAELKVVQDDDMLFQGLDYYDYLSRHVETYARLYQKHGIDPQKPIRLLLIAPSFSMRLVNRCKWLNVPVTLITYQCLRFDGDEEIVPVFSEHLIPPPDEPPVVTSIDGHLEYITDLEVRGLARTFLDEVKQWNPAITLDPIKYSISLKVNGRFFAYLSPRRKFFLIDTLDDVEQWIQFSIKDKGDLEDSAIRAMKHALERRSK